MNDRIYYVNGRKVERWITVNGVYRPILVDEEEFDLSVGNRQLIYRGIKDNPNKNMKSQDIIEDILSDAPIYHGYHAHGYGLYFTTNRDRASSDYAQEDSVITAYLNTNANVVKELDLWAQLEAELGKGINNKYLSSYALAKGYNVIQVEGGPHGSRNSILNKGASGEDYYIALIKDVLTIRKPRKNNF